MKRRKTEFKPPKYVRIGDDVFETEDLAEPYVAMRRYFYGKKGQTHEFREVDGRAVVSFGPCDRRDYELYPKGSRTSDDPLELCDKIVVVAEEGGKTAVKGIVDADERGLSTARLLMRRDERAKAYGAVFREEGLRYAVEITNEGITPMKGKRK